MYLHNLFQKNLREIYVVLFATLDKQITQEILNIALE